MLARNLNWTEAGVSSGQTEDGLMRSNALEESLIDFDDAASERLSNTHPSGNLITQSSRAICTRRSSESTAATTTSLLNNNGNRRHLSLSKPATIPTTPNDNSDLLRDFDSVAKILPNTFGVSNLNLLCDSLESGGPESSMNKMSDAYLSGVKSESLKTHNNHNLRQGQISAPNTPEMMRKQHFLTRYRPDLMGSPNPTQQPPLATAKRDKMEFNQQMMIRMNHNEFREGRPLSYHGRSIGDSNSSLSSQSTISNVASSPVNKRHVGSPLRNRNKESNLLNRRSMPAGAYQENRFRDKFDISDLDTNLPRIDIEAIENHLRLAREEERKRRTDRDEIRRRLALESEDLNSDKPGRKPSLHSRLQSSMNLQICFMNETASDSESPGSDSEVKPTQQPASLPYVKTTTTGIGANAGAGVGVNNGGITGIRDRSGPSSTKPSEDFFSRQARLQADARQALSQAKDLAKLQMSNDKERRVHSPITEMVRNSLLKVGVSLPPERRRVSRQLLTEMNVAQLQVIVNDLHTHIEVLNETLVSMLLDRDDLHMEQDSMLVDIEDLTRYLAAKDSSNSPHQSLPLIASSKLLLGRK